MTDDLTERARAEARQRLDSRWSSDPHPDLTGMPEGEGRAYIFGFAQGAAWAAEQSAAHDDQVREEVAADIEARLASANSHGEHFGLRVAAAIARYGDAR